jgi:hypothetical protein
MLRVQKKKMFVNTFIRKLKQSIIRRDTIEHPSLEIHEDESDES